MESNQPRQGRPSALPAAAVSAVDGVLGFDPGGQLDGAAVPGMPTTGWSTGADVMAAARVASEFPADHRIVGKGSRVPAPVSGFTGVQQTQTKQINVVTAYRRNGVGGVPPRGRPN